MCLRVSRGAHCLVLKLARPKRLAGVCIAAGAKLENLFVQA